MIVHTKQTISKIACPLEGGGVEEGKVVYEGSFYMNPIALYTDHKLKALLLPVFKDGTER